VGLLAKMISIVYFVLSCCRPSTKGSCPPTRSLGQQRVFTAEARLHTAGQRVFTANARPHTSIKHLVLMRWKGWVYW